jgi:MOSC domain-containing protein YiiM
MIDLPEGHAPQVLAVCSNPRHGFSKSRQAVIRLLAGRGVEGDAHCGETVQHLYLKRKNPLSPNLMQVHLLQAELFAELSLAGFEVQPGDFGENITTRNLDLLTLPLGTRLHVGENAIVELTGLRTPCKKIEDFHAGLLRQVALREGGKILQAKAGVMAIVLHGGVVAPGDAISIRLPDGNHMPMQMI